MEKKQLETTGNTCIMTNFWIMNNSKLETTLEEKPYRRSHKSNPDKV